MKELDAHEIVRIDAHETARVDPAFTFFFERYNREIYFYICHIILNEYDAQDVCLETFVAASRSWSQIRGLDEKPLRKWLYVTAHNEAFDYFRSWRHRFRHWTYTQSTEPRVLDLVQECSSQQAVLEGLELSQLLDSIESQRIRDNLAKLSKRECECLLLRAHDFSTPEIAEICKLKESSVRANIARAIKKYKEVDEAWSASSQNQERSK